MMIRRICEGRLGLGDAAGGLTGLCAEGEREWASGQLVMRT